MKKICIICPEGYPVPATKGGAVETLVESIINQNELYKKLDIVCIARYEKDAYEKSKNIKNTKFEYFKMPSNSKYVQIFLNLFFRAVKKFLKINLKYKIHCKRLYKMMKKYDFDFIVVEGGDPNEYKELLNYFDRNQCALHLHGGDIVGNKEWDRIYGKYIALNNFLKNRFISTNIVSKEQVEVVHNGIDTNKFQKKLSVEEKNSLKKKLKINENDKIVLFCGRIIREKGVLELIKAFKNIKTRNTTLLIIGSAEFGNKTATNYEKEVEREIADLEEKIIFTGFVHNTELYKYYNLADIAVIPSMWEEASPLVAAEMMNSGLPLICTNSGGLPEIVSDECAYIIKRDDKLVENMSNQIDILLNDDNLRKERANASRSLGEKYSIKNFYDEFVCSIEKFIREE